MGKDITPLLSECREDLLKLHRNLTLKKRTAASHVLVFYIAHEERKGKPYGIPVQFVACNTLTDKQHRALVDAIKKEMIVHGLVPVGKYDCHIGNLLLESLSRFSTFGGE